MNNIFSVDNPVFNIIGKLYDMIVMSILWTIISIPIITVGPATTAMYYATVKVLRRERGYLFREFFKSFKLNFKSGLKINLIIIPAALILYFDIIYANRLLDQNILWGYLLMVVAFIATFLLGCITLYIFPLLSRFDTPVKALFKNALIIAIQNLPSTFIMLITSILLIAITIVIPVSIIIVPAILTLLISLLMERILKKYTPKSEENQENTEVDEWYLE